MKAKGCGIFSYVESFDRYIYLSTARVAEVDLNYDVVKSKVLRNAISDW